MGKLPNETQYILPFKFNSPRTRAIKRIGPHNILSIIIGSLLGDAEKHGLEIRICFQQALLDKQVTCLRRQEDNRSAYLFWLHSSVSKLGYYNEKIPELSRGFKRTGKVGGMGRYY